MRSDDARAFFGLGSAFSAEELKQARKSALFEAHPDRGGSRERFELVQVAYDTLINDSQARKPVDQIDFGRRDCPSFTIDVLPVEAFDSLLMAAAELGEVIDDEPPYRLEVMMLHPHDDWVVFDLVPEAGSTTVNMSVEGRPSQSLEMLRDRWIDALNALQQL